MVEPVGNPSCDGARVVTTIVGDEIPNVKTRSGARDCRRIRRRGHGDPEAAELTVKESNATGR